MKFKTHRDYEEAIDSVNKPLMDYIKNNPNDKGIKFETLKKEAYDKVSSLQLENKELIKSFIYHH